MKFLIVFALIAAASAAPRQRFGLLDLLGIGRGVQTLPAVIGGDNISAGPAVIGGGVQTLPAVIGGGNIAVGPAIIDGGVQTGPAAIGGSNIAVGPAIIGGGVQTLPAIIGGDNISVGPAVIGGGVQTGPAVIGGDNISVGPAIIEGDASAGPAIAEEESASPAAVNPPAFNPFNLDGPLVQVVVNVDGESSNDVTVDQVYNPEVADIKPEPVIIAEPEVKPDPVDVIDTAPALVPEVVSVQTPIIPEIANLPDTLN